MNMTSLLPRVFTQDHEALVAEWVKIQTRLISQQGLVSEPVLREQCAAFLGLLSAWAESDFSARDERGEALQAFLAEVSARRGQQGFSPSETAQFVFSLKTPLFDRLRAAHGADAALLAEDVMRTSRVLDQLGLYTTEVFQKTRDDIIRRQQQDLLELSTPVVKLWNGILALPLVGTLDSARTQVVMESLLNKIVETGSDVAIIDITGVPTVDTLVAQHLLKTVTAARLMGAECIVSGVRPQIAQTIVHLGVNLGDVITKASLADAFRVALERTGQLAQLK